MNKIFKYTDFNTHVFISDFELEFTSDNNLFDINISKVITHESFHTIQFIFNLKNCENFKLNFKFTKLISKICDFTFNPSICVHNKNIEFPECTYKLFNINQNTQIMFNEFKLDKLFVCFRLDNYNKKRKIEETSIRNGFNESYKILRKNTDVIIHKNHTMGYPYYLSGYNNIKKLSFSESLYKDYLSTHDKLLINKYENAGLNNALYILKKHPLFYNNYKSKNLNSPIIKKCDRDVLVDSNAFNAGLLTIENINNNYITRIVDWNNVTEDIIVDSLLIKESIEDMKGVIAIVPYYKDGTKYLCYGIIVSTYILKIKMKDDLSICIDDSDSKVNHVIMVNFYYTDNINYVMTIPLKDIILKAYIKEDTPHFKKSTPFGMIIENNKLIYNYYRFNYQHQGNKIQLPMFDEKITFGFKYPELYSGSRIHN